ncbi:MAG TPA: hypothetical protein VKY74_10190 [Chloroflexia bacterium]|nr:hypothetical protein [Chloroflexia bacterium]
MLALSTPSRRRRGILALLLTLGLTGGLGVRAQGTAHTFPETGHTVAGLFWTYWQAHGGLAQQGYPLTEEFTEVSDLNGQPYTVQYFERAVFEKHPENQPPYDVLLSQLGTVRYQQKYPNGAPNQQPAAGGVLFKETGHVVGGRFLQYWQQHGGLAQQGFPISDEFTEVSPLNGQSYTVQYFERAVFEKHPENQPPFDVLLSQLGTFQLRQKYPGGAPTPAVTVGPPPAGTPQPVPAAIRDLLTKSDAAMNALTNLKGHSVNLTTDNGTTTTDYADYQYQAPDRQYLKVTSPRPGQPDAIAEVIRIGAQRFQRTGASGPWTMSTDPTPYHWPEYNKVYVADHAQEAILESPTTINGVPVQVVRVAIPITIQGTVYVDQYIEFFISTIDYRDLREVTTVPALPPSRTANGVYTTDFGDFNVPNGILPPASVK